MCRRFLPPLAPVVLLLALSACDTPKYKNAAHPGYGETEYKNDLAECRKQHSKIVVSGGYDDKASLEVDEPKAQSCMSERGWQQVSR